MAALQGDRIVDVLAEGRDRGAEDRAAGVVRRREGVLRMRLPSQALRLPVDDGTPPARLASGPACGRPSVLARVRLARRARSSCDRARARGALRAACGRGRRGRACPGRVEGDPDAIYVFDPTLIADGGAVLLVRGRQARRGEPEALGADLDQAGVPVAGRLEGTALAEGGDLIRFDERTLLVGPRLPDESGRRRRRSSS